MNDYLSEIDYTEPRCPLDMHPEYTPIPIGRVIDKLDSCLKHNDYPAAERHLNYWLNEADACHDMRGRLTLLNEQIGLYRKTGNEAGCLHAASESLALADSMDIGQSLTYGTTLINAATGYKAFGKGEEALPLYTRAQSVYEDLLPPDDKRLGALYNNMAITLTDLGYYPQAEEYFNKAIRIMETQDNGVLEVAITCLNLADLAAVRYGLDAGADKIEALVSKAEKLLNTEGLPKDGYYAFVCEKCAPVFGYYGYFLTEKEMLKRAKEIYERT